MESRALLDSIDQLHGSLETLEDVLSPILEDSMSATTKKLRLLDRAKMHVTFVYAIESLLFSHLKLLGGDPREHPVYKELERVKQYFAKVKEAEDGITTKPSIALNKQAAARMIQHSLAGNGSSDMTQRAKELREKIMAKRRSANSNSDSPVAATVNPPVAEAAEVAAVLDSISRDLEMQDQEGSEEGEIDESALPSHPLPQKSQSDANQNQSSRKKRKHDQGQPSKLSIGQKAEKKARKKAKKEAKALANGNAAG